MLKFSELINILSRQIFELLNSDYLITKFVPYASVIFYNGKKKNGYKSSKMVILDQIYEKQLYCAIHFNASL